MSITITAAKRRGKTFKYIKGSVVDIGCGPFPIEKLYTGITEFKGWDMADGDAQYMVGCKQYDVVHSSHSLEHMVDPIEALRRWIEVAKKYLVIILPDEEMYERLKWPSQFNSDHKWSFTTHFERRLPNSINVLDMLRLMEDIEVVKVERITHGFCADDPRDHTQRNIECAIEIILKKV